MKSFLTTIFLLSWALWFGGQMTLFLSVIALFKHDRTIAIQAAPQLFFTFERYQIFIALIAVASSAALFLLTRRRLHLWTTALLWLASIGAFVSVAIITPRIMELREQNLVQTPQFDSLHHRATYIYDTEFLLLFVAGLLIPRILSCPPQQQTTSEYSPAAMPLV